MRHSPKSSFSKWFVLVGAVLLCELAGGIGALFTMPSVSTWYAGLLKPALTPPGWVFGPVWTTLYALMGIALFLVWLSKSARRKGYAYAFFGIQLVLNVCWSVIFFGWHNPGLAFVELVALWTAIVATIIAFYRISRPAALFLLPYLLWVSFAGYLNFSVWQLNRVAPDDISLPIGYSLKSYTVAETLPVACTKNDECETPGKYMIRSNCPYTSLCLKNKCTVVCPTYENTK